MHALLPPERTLIGAISLLTCFWIATGCGRSAADRSLESDARGYVCQGCKAKFYTDYEVIADICPQCKSYDIHDVVGFVCAADSHVTLAPRGRGAMPCEKCGKPASSLKRPAGSDLKAWGAARATKAQVSPQ